MISIGIIDDEQQWIDKIDDLIMTNFKEIKVYHSNSVHSIVDDLDFILLDIDMPNADGIAFSKQNLDLKIIFVTNYDTRIKEAFGPNVYGYVSKSNLKEELVQKIAEMIELVKNDYIVTFKVNKQDVAIRLADIIYCQYIGGHTVSIVCKNRCITINDISLKKVIKMLDERFISINRDTIVNKHLIVNYQNQYVYLAGVNSKFEVSVRNMPLVKRCFYEGLR